MIAISAQNTYFSGKTGMKRKPLNRVDREMREFANLTKNIARHREKTAQESENHRQRVVSNFHAKYNRGKI